MTAQHDTAAPAPPPSMLRRYVFAGLSASLVSIGLARFAYTPLIPPLIHAHWFSANDVVYLSAANLAGYLIGAVTGRRIAARISNVYLLRLMMTLVTTSLVACAFPLSVIWFFFWRLLSGVGGGAIMVVVAATVLPHMPAHRRGAASGAVFLGVGLGIAASGTLVPLLLKVSLLATWLGLAAISAALTAATWRCWPPRAAQTMTERPQHGSPRPAHTAVVALLYAEYALMAIGLVAPMVFLVDFVARGLGAGNQLGAIIWIFYGIGSMLGPPLYGLIADRAGARAAVRLLLTAQAIAVAGLARSNQAVALGILSVIIGSFPPGIVPMVLAWIRELYPGDQNRQNAVWSGATIDFAAFQALAAYAFSAIYAASGGDYRLIFMFGAGALLLAVLLDLLGNPTPA